MCESDSPLAGEGWGGGKPHTLSPETSASTEASVDEAADKSAVPEWRPHPTLPATVFRPGTRWTDREREREANTDGWNDGFYGTDRLGPFYPRQQTSRGCAGMSVWGELRT